MMQSFIWYSECMNDDDFHEFETDIYTGNSMLMGNWQFYPHGSWLWLCQKKGMIKWHCMISLEVKYQSKIRSEFFICFFTYNFICLLLCVSQCNSPVLFFWVAFSIQEFIPLCMLLLKLIVVDKILLKQTWLSKWLLNFDRMKCSGAAKLASEVQELLSNYYLGCDSFT